MFNTPYEKAILDLARQSLELDQEFGFAPKRQVIRCKICGTTLDDFMDTGFVGCAECYKSFKDYAINLALDIHGRSAHIGKVPKAEATKAVKKRELERLIAEKDKAVKEEKFLLANDLKDRIDRLREEL